MAQPQIESFTVSDDGLTITLKYDQILYGKTTYNSANNPSIITDSDYSQVIFFQSRPTLEEFYEGFDTVVYYNPKDFYLESALPINGPAASNLVTKLTTNFQVTDLTNAEGEAPINVTDLVLDTSSTPAYIPNLSIDILSTFDKKERKQASRDKILCVYNTAAVSGILDEPLIDAYFDEYGITNHIKVGVDFSDASNVDERWWTGWGASVLEMVYANGIEQVCCGPMCPGNISHGGTADIRDVADTSTALGMIKNIGVQLEREGRTDLLNTRILNSIISFDTTGKEPPSDGYPLDYYWSANLEPGEQATRLKLSYIDGAFKADINGLDLATFGGQYGVYANVSVPGLNYNSYEPSKIPWAYTVKPVQNRTNRMPCWRIGYYPLGNVAIPTTAIIRQMVRNSKAASLPTEQNKKEKVLLTNTYYTTQSLYSASDTVFLSHLWESLGYTKNVFGYANIPYLISDLTNAPGKVVGDTGLTKYEYQASPSPSGTIDFTMDLDVTPQANDATNVYLDSDWMQQWGNVGEGVAVRAKTTGTTFPIEADIILDQVRNVSSGLYNGELRDAFVVKPGGIRFAPTSNGHRFNVYDLANGASAAFGSWYEPFARAVVHQPQMIAELLRGHTIASANMFTNDHFARGGSIWGDGLLQPYYEQAQGNEMNNVKFQLTATKSYVTYGGSVPAVTNGGTGHAVGDIITLNGGVTGSGVRVKVESLGASDAVATYSWVSGGSGWANSEVATQSNTSGSGTTLVFTMPSNFTTFADPVGYGFFSEPLTSDVGNSNILYNNAGMEFAFSQFSPAIPDVHAIIGVPTANGFVAPAGFHIWAEGELDENPYGGNLTLFVNGTGYPILQEYFDNNSVTWEKGDTPNVTAGYSRLIWKQTGVTDPLPVTILEGDNIGLSLAVPDAGEGSPVERNIITHNTISKG